MELSSPKPFQVPLNRVKQESFELLRHAASVDLISFIFASKFLVPTLQYGDSFPEALLGLHTSLLYERVS